MGRPSKPDLTAGELQYIHDLRGQGYGWRYIANQVSLNRGAAVLDSKLRRDRTVSTSWLYRAVRSKTPTVPKQRRDQVNGAPYQNGLRGEVR